MSIRQTKLCQPFSNKAVQVLVRGQCLLWNQFFSQRTGCRPETLVPPTQWHQLFSGPEQITNYVRGLGTGLIVTMDGLKLLIIAVIENQS